MKKTLMLSAAAAAFLLAGTASAIVTFDPYTGTGFVGKGDVQNAFGWNNKQLQTNALNVSFRYEETVNYPVTCSWTTGPAHNPTTHHVQRTKVSGVNSDLNGSPRPGPNQFTGFTLDGYMDEPVGGAAPEVGDNCQAIGLDANPDATVSAVGDPVPVSSGLFVLVNGGTPTQIYP